MYKAMTKFLISLRTDISNQPTLTIIYYFLRLHLKYRNSSKYRLDAPFAWSTLRPAGLDPRLCSCPNPSEHFLSSAGHVTALDLSFVLVTRSCNRMGTLGFSLCELCTIAEGTSLAHYELLTVSWSHSVNSRLRRGAFEVAIALATFPWLWSYISGLGEEEETKKATDRSKTRSEDDGHADEEDDDVEIPETMPEDAIFIPLGLARQRPETYYKAADPEWQSFIEYRKDREREPAIKSLSRSFLSRRPNF